MTRPINTTGPMEKVSALPSPPSKPLSTEPLMTNTDKNNGWSQFERWAGESYFGTKKD